MLPSPNRNLLDNEVLQWRIDLGLDGKLIGGLRELRECFAPRASALTAERASAAQRVAIAALRAGAQGDRETSIQTDVDFHVAVLAGSGTAFIISLSELMEPVLQASFEIA